MSTMGLNELIHMLSLPIQSIPKTTPVVATESQKDFPKLDVESIAQVCHEACRSVCEADGDTTRPSWKDAPDWQKTAIRKGVAYVQEHPDAPAGALHDSWMKEKTDAGWKYGKVKDKDAKTHPCLVPYEELPLVERVKDHLIKSLVQTLS